MGKKQTAEQVRGQDLEVTNENAATEAAGGSAEGGSSGGGQGAAVLLPNGERRVDYIRRRYYDEGAKRGDIRREINEMLEKAGQPDKKIAYQIVFAATKTKEDPRKPKSAPAAEAPAEASTEATDS